MARVGHHIIPGIKDARLDEPGPGGSLVDLSKLLILSEKNMKSELYLCLFATLLYGLVLCDHHEGHKGHDAHGGHGKEGKHGHSDHPSHHHHHNHHNHHHKHHGNETMACHKISQSISKFAFQLFNHSLGEGESRNVFFSPVSIATALAMLSVGAKNATLGQILHGLNFNLSSISIDDIHESFNHLIEMLNKADGELQLSMGNALFIKEGLKLLPTFLNDVKTQYHSEAFSTNFENEEEAKKQINDYVKTHTNGKIVDFLKSLDQQTAMVLVNYIFFRGKWEMPFEEENTKEDDFHVDEKTVVKVPMMFRSGMYSSDYDEDLSCTVVKIPYKGDTSALLILPKEGKMKQVQDALSGPTVMKWVKSLAHRRGPVDLFLPRFSISTTLELKDILEDLGMTDMFIDHADFSGITGEPNLKVSNAVHKAMLSIDEKGTEAAGTTTLEIMPMSLPPTVKFDRPFLVLIYHKQTRSTLFMGKIVNPTAN
ncbi:alpha-1-antitrypsin-like [Lissotriton helveticus]